MCLLMKFDTKISVTRHLLAATLETNQSVILISIASAIKRDLMFYIDNRNSRENMYRIENHVCNVSKASSASETVGTE